jgi:hypothetical protein
MENGRMNDYTSADLTAAILSLRDATASGFAKADLKTDRLRDDMNRRFDLVDDRFDRTDARLDRMDARFDRMDERFDHMDGRFDRLEGRVAALEPHDHSPAS